MTAAGGPIVVGLDGSVASERAVRWAAELGRALGAEVVAVHAVGLLEAGQDGPAAGALERARVEGWCAPLDAAPCRYRAVVRDGTALDVLLAATDEEHPRLVVVGSRGTGGKPALTLGSTSLHLLQATRVPVLVVPDHGGPATPASLAHLRILVGVDRSAHSLAALGVAAELAEVGGGAVTALEVSEFVRPFPIVMPAGPPIRRGWTNLEQALGEIRARGVHVQPVTLSGLPVPTILEVADGLGVGLIVVGTRGRGGPDDLALGSVARSVADRSHHPVLVVPAEAGAVHLRADA